MTWSVFDLMAREIASWRGGSRRARDLLSEEEAYYVAVDSGRALLHGETAALHESQLLRVAPEVARALGRKREARADPICGLKPEGGDGEIEVSEVGSKLSDKSRRQAVAKNKRPALLTRGARSMLYTHKRSGSCSSQGVVAW